MGKTLTQKAPAPSLRRPWPSSRSFLFGALILFCVLLSPFLSTIFLAVIFAFFLYPFVIHVQRRFHISRKRFLTTTFTLILALMFVGSAFGVTSLFDLTKANRDILMSINQLEFKIPERLEKEISKRFPEQTEQVSRLAQESFQSLKDFLVRTTGDIFQSVPFFFMNVIVFFLALHFFLANSSSIRLRLMHMRLAKPENIRFILRSCREAARETFISVLVIGLVQTAIVTIGAGAVGFQYVVMVFFVTFTLSLIPVIGAAPVAFLIGVYFFFQGEIVKGVIMIAVGVVTGGIDNVLRSFLMAKSNQMPAGISFVCLIGAIIVFGFYGVFFGPFLGFLAARFLTRRINDGTTLA